ncbi:tRNA pseudouridine(55) synthase TruB [Candidatus Saccharibacteria bacterium]|nr:tRNA pseudouridine(55) synthase TruB [Candidatus Saccharibacteria bacterium]
MDLTNEEILLVDKPTEMSSFAVVARIRRVLTEQARAKAIKLGQTPPKRAKVGHAGTLDPFATGLLILLLGKSTKRASEFLKLDKSYEATIELGKVSTTGDVEGEITDYADGNLEPPTLEEIQNTLAMFRGEIVQKVPAFSAVKINGERAYKLARAGKKVKMPERKIKIYDIKIINYKWPYLTISCDVSSGTYIRQLGIDIGEKLGVGGYLTALRRTRIGIYSIKDAKKLEDYGIID